MITFFSNIFISTTNQNNQWQSSAHFIVKRTKLNFYSNFRYGRSLAEVEEELERLVSVGELARVDYKGSASFRIVQPEAKAKRRRRGTKPLGRTPSRTPVPLGGVFPPITPSNGPIEQNMPQSPILPPAQSPPPLTLRTLGMT